MHVAFMNTAVLVFIFKNHLINFQRDLKGREDNNQTNYNFKV